MNRQDAKNVGLQKQSGRREYGGQTRCRRGLWSFSGVLGALCGGRLVI